jgi:hypothetical protein
MVLTKTDEFQIIWNWQSRTFIGPIAIGKPAAAIIQKYNLPFIEEYSDSEQKVYEFPDDTTIRVEDGLIDSVSFKSNFIYKNINLIGVPIENVRTLLGEEDTVDDNFEEQICFEFDKYSLMVWVGKNTGKVESVSCF